MHNFEIRRLGVLPVQLIPLISAFEGGWWEYESRARDELEINYKNGMVSMTTILCGNVYEIDFQEMVQYPKDHPRRKRRIRREGPDRQLWVRGVAGIRNENVDVIE